MINENDVIIQYERLVQMMANRYHQIYAGRYDYEDFAQAARLGVLEAARTYDPESGNKLITHVYNKARYSIGRMLRRDTGLIKVPTKLAKSAVVPQRVILPNDWEPQQQDPVVFDAIQDRVVLEDAIKTLTPNQRKVVTGLYFEQKQASEIADELKCATNTVYVTAQRAMTKLRTYFAERELETV